MKFHRGFRFYILLVAGLAVALTSAGTSFADEQAATTPGAAAATFVAARAGISPNATTLTLEFNGEFTYQPTTSSDRLIFVDLPGVLSRQASDSRILESSNVVSSYRVVPYVDGSRQGARLEVLLKQPAKVSYQQGAGSLEVKFQAAGKGTAAEPAAVVANKTAVAPEKPQARAKSLRAHGDAIEDVTFSREGESTRVRVIANGPVDYQPALLPNPVRLVLDIPNAAVRANHAINVGQAPLKSIRVAQFRRSPLVTRVVLELDSEVRYNVQRTENGLEVELGGRALPESKPQTAVAAAETAKSVAPPASATPAEGHKKPEPVLIASLKPEEIRMPSPAAHDAPPLAPMNVAAAAETQPVTQQAVPPSLPPMPVQAPPVPAPRIAGQVVTPVEAGQATPVGPRYTGEPISVNLKDVDLKDFFRLIHEISGLNIVLDPSVSGRVTIVLEDVPWDQALDIVLRNNGLVKQLEGNVLRIAKTSTVQQEEQEKLRIAQAQQEAAERVTVMRPINYAKAGELLPTLAKFRSTKGEIIADLRTNTLIVTDIPQVIPTIDEVIRTLDRRSVQVEIEARVVAASRSFSRDIGAQFGFGTTAAGGKTLFTGNLIGQSSSPAAITGLPNPLSPLVSAATSLPLFSNFPAAGANTGFSILHRSPNAAIDLLITAAETKGIGKLLSRPRIITQNNVQGSVQQGVKIPVQTTVNNTISVQFFDVTLQLIVTPQVTNDGTIFLQVRVSNTTIDPGIARINGVPALDTQEATTQVLVPDGGTVVFGGVLQNTNNITIQQVPVLGSIPVLGNLFKRTGVNTTTNELLFFLTPKVV